MAALLNVFMYHRILPVPHDEAVETEMFRRQVTQLQERYRMVSGDEARDFILKGQAFGSKPLALLTFDDGWLDNLLFATPVLRERGCPAVLALATGYLHDGPVRTVENSAILGRGSREAQEAAVYDQDHRSFLRRSEVRRMLESGLWSLQAHGHRHQQGFVALDGATWPDSQPSSLRQALDGRLPAPGTPAGRLGSTLALPRKRLSAGPPWRLEAEESVEQFQARLLNDLTTCRQEIRELAGRCPSMLFWPWGQYSRVSLAVARQAGFDFTFTVAKGYVVPGDQRFVLPRIGVSADWTKFVKNGVTFRSRWLSLCHRFSRSVPVCLDRDLGG